MCFRWGSQSDGLFRILASKWLSSRSTEENVSEHHRQVNAEWSGPGSVFGYIFTGPNRKVPMSPVYLFTQLQEIEVVAESVDNTKTGFLSCWKVWEVQYVY
jgi:hypothetical protein